MAQQELNILIKVALDYKDVPQTLKKIQDEVKKLTDKVEEMGNAGDESAKKVENKLENLTKKLPSFGGAFGKVSEGLEKAWKTVDGVFKASVIILIIDEIIGVVEKLSEWFGALSNGGGLLGRVLNGIGEIIKTIIGIFTAFTDAIGLTSIAQDKMSKDFLENIEKERIAVEQYYTRRIELAKAAGEGVQSLEADLHEKNVNLLESELRTYESILNRKGALKDEELEKYNSALAKEFEYTTSTKAQIINIETSTNNTIKSLVERRVNAEISLMKDGVGKNNALLSQQLSHTKDTYNQELKSLQDAHNAQMKQIEIFYKFWGNKDDKAAAQRIANANFKKASDELDKTRKVEEAAQRAETAKSNKEAIKADADKRKAIADKRLSDAISEQQKLLAVEQKTMSLLIADGKELTQEKSKQLNESLSQQEKYSIAILKLQKYTGKDAEKKRLKDIEQTEQDYFQKRKTNLDAFTKYIIDNDLKLNKSKSDLDILTAKSLREKQIAQKAGIDADLAIAEKSAKDSIKNEELFQSELLRLRQKAITDKKAIDDKILTDEQKYYDEAELSAAEHQVKMSQYDGTSEEKIAALQNLNDAKTQQLLDQMNLELENAEMTGQSKLDIESKYNRQIAENTRQTQDEINKIKLDGVQKGIEYAQMGANALTSLGELITNLDSNNRKKSEKEQLASAKKAFKIQKSLSLVNAAISTAQGIAVGLTAPFPLNIVMPVIAGVTGALQIAAIASKKFDGGGSGGDSGSGGGSSSPLTGGAGSVVPQFNPSTFANLGNAQINNVSTKDNRVYVLESDITMSQNRVATIEERARINGG